MLCFNWTVRFPLSVPVLSRLLSVRRNCPERQAKAVHPQGFLARNHREAIPSWVARRLLAQGPTHPTLRANPFPEVTDLFCRLPLSTLFYQLEAVHLGDLLRL